ncbi:TfoX/Sxy family protein [Pedobacter fastidiosus]|uniref:TfoX/Sxy family protein n=1 Tax=Pedobacter fastidiosus TaxID=2765361 RepID=A0ABR7KST9_9SPHI|nr:TfoX/Sxy family protein [Pedobacter fastidiosus]MBC6111122.1 TfoX/Sxy family protein [Pedobacter fastidiosus]
MRYDENLANRIREKLMFLPILEEKEMFSGLVFMVDGKMCIGVMKNKIMLRIDPESLTSLEDKDGWEQMVMKMTVMKGYILVSEDVVNQNKDLYWWLDLALEFNPRAKASKKKK